MKKIKIGEKYFFSFDLQISAQVIIFIYYTVNRFIFAALNFCDFGTLGLLRAFYFCAIKVQNIVLSKTKVEF